MANQKREATRLDREAGKNVSRTVGENIKKYRESLDMTPRELAEKLSVTLETVYRLEKGSVVPSLGRLSRISVELKVPLYRLFHLTQFELNDCLYQDAVDTAQHELRLITNMLGDTSDLYRLGGLLKKIRGLVESLQKIPSKDAKLSTLEQLENLNSEKKHYFS